MDRAGVDRLSCVVCGIETKRHAGWFLVMDNCWLDRVKVLSWHPVLAHEKGMRSVCGKPHLKALLTHWFEHANLQLDPGTFRQLQPSPDDTPQSPSEYGIVAQGRVLGELAVERDPRSTLWTGSRQSMEHILNALIGETEARSRGLPRSAPERWVGYPQDYAHR